MVWFGLTKFGLVDAPAPRGPDPGEGGGTEKGQENIRARGESAISTELGVIRTNVHRVDSYFLHLTMQCIMHT